MQVQTIKASAGPVCQSEQARAEVDRLIAATQNDSIEFPYVLANHLPMVLEAMARLGASAERLREFYDFYRSENKVPPPAGPVAPIDRMSWRSALGDRSREADYRAFFQGEVSRLGGSAAIRHYVPQLAPGVAASALHAMMRTAYGVMRNDDIEIGTALGYWATCYLPLRDEPAGPPDIEDPLGLALAMHGTPSYANVEPESDHLWHWMREVGTMDCFAPLIGRWKMGPDCIERVARLSAALYASTMTFEAVHAVTGTHWVRLISPHLDDPHVLLKPFWAAILSVYPKIGRPAPASADELDALRAMTPPPDAERAAIAVASNDEHDHSFTFSALTEFARTGDPLYRVLAAKRLGMLA